MGTKRVIEQMKNNKPKVRQIQSNLDSFDDNFNEIKQERTRNTRSMKNNIVPTTIAIIALDQF